VCLCVIVILLLDTFFHVVGFHGETVAAWWAAGYGGREGGREGGKEGDK